MKLSHSFLLLTACCPFDLRQLAHCRSLGRARVDPHASCLIDELQPDAITAEQFHERIVERQEPGVAGRGKVASSMFSDSFKARRHGSPRVLHEHSPGWRTSPTPCSQS